MHRYPPPNLHDLLPPVLACLPTAFFSQRPPPAFLPLLSPILRQRLSLHAATTNNAPLSSTSSTRPTWLNLLTWSPARASRLADVVASLNLEPHPVSGELELFDEEVDAGGHAESATYRRLDAETLQAKCDVRKYGVSVVWVWCTNDSGGVGLENAGSAKGEDGWRVAEVRACEDEQEEGAAADERWYPTQGDAEAAAKASGGDAAPQNNDRLVPPSAQPADDADEDDYWASYDRTPASRTPAKRSPGLGPGHSLGMTGLGSARNKQDAEERDYFERYRTVQPAMDGHDPDEARDSGAFDSTLGSEQGNGKVGGQRREEAADTSDIQPLPTPPPSKPLPPLGLGLDTSAANTYNASDPRTAVQPPPPNTAIEAPIYLREALERQSAAQQMYQTQPSAPSRAHANTIAGVGAGTAVDEEAESIRIHSPQPSRPPSPPMLEKAAAATTAAEFGVKQHISTEIKSLYRLAKAAGIERDEFERCIVRELEVLGLMDGGL